MRSLNKNKILIVIIKKSTKWAFCFEEYKDSHSSLVTYSGFQDMTFSSKILNKVNILCCYWKCGC